MDLPPSAQEIADVIGRDRALFLIGNLPAAGGRSWRRVLYVPKRMGRDHPLVQLMGAEDAERLRRHFGGAILQPANCGYIARAFRDREVRRMAAEGVPVTSIAASVGLSDYRVREILRSVEGNPPEESPATNDNFPTMSAKGNAMRGRK